MTDASAADYVAEADSLEDELRAFQWLRRQPDDAPVVADELGRHEALSTTGENRVVYYPDGAEPESDAWIDAPRGVEVDLRDVR
jgi:hypothetical protein